MTILKVDSFMDMVLTSSQMFRLACRVDHYCKPIKLTPQNHLCGSCGL